MASDDALRLAIASAVAGRISEDELDIRTAQHNIGHSNTEAHVAAKGRAERGDEIRVAAGERKRRTSRTGRRVSPSRDRAEEYACVASLVLDERRKCASQR